jgi:hypothetical protein
MAVSMTIGWIKIGIMGLARLRLTLRFIKALISWRSFKITPMYLPSVTLLQAKGYSPHKIPDVRSGRGSAMTFSAELEQNGR